MSCQTDAYAVQRSKKNFKIIHGEWIQKRNTRDRNFIWIKLFNQGLKNELYHIFFLLSRDDLLTAVEYLIKNESTPLDFILIETNGLADPSAVRSSRIHLF